VGGEDHIVMGNFHKDSNTSSLPVGGGWPGTNYYVDDVSVELQVPVIQACCLPDNSCSMQYPGECTLLGGTPAGAGTSCTPNPCLVTASRAGTWGALKVTYR